MDGERTETVGLMSGGATGWNADDELDDEKGNWDITISPKSGILNLNLTEIWYYRDLIRLFVKRDFTAKYKQTILGPLWHVIQPALTTLVSFILFNVVANISTDGKNPLLFQMSGIVIWSYFSACITNTSNTFIANSKIFGKVYFPRLVSPIAITISNLIQFAIQLGLLLALIAFFAIRNDHAYIGWSWLLAPVVLGLMAGISLGLGIIISSLTTKYRDLQVLVTFGVQLLMFASAVNYPMSKLGKLADSHPVIYFIIKWNPLATLVETFRNGMLGGPVWYGGLAYSTAFMLVVLLAGILVFNRVEKTFMDTV
jgi:lipopolysaccharide transport system permease protein